MSSSRSFYHVLSLWHHIMWHVMWLQCHVPLHCPKSRKENKINIKSETLDKRKEKLLVSKAFYNTEWPNTVIIGAAAFLHASKLLGFSNFKLCLCFLDIQANSTKLAKASDLSNVSSILWNALNTNIFLFLLSIFLDFIFLFLYWRWRGIWHCSHMTGHMMWHHRPRT